MSSDVSEAMAALVLTLGLCFSFLIIGIEAAVGGDVGLVTSFGPAVFSVVVAFLVDHGESGDSASVEPAHEQAEPTEL